MQYGEAMRICLLGDYAGILDEGMRNTSFYLYRELSRRHKVLYLCLRPFINLLSPGFWHQTRDFNPQIIHFVPGSTIKTFLFVKALKLFDRRAAIIMSVTHPALSAFSQSFVPLVKPDLILAQFSETAKMFQRLGCRTQLLLNGVDSEKFVPVSPEVKLKLRRKYNLDENKFIILHVGPIERGRNILLLNELQKEDNCQVIIVGSVSAPMERDVYRALIQGGCLVWKRYFENVAEIYALSDCYVFPTVRRRNCVDLSLSVMEAMSCNLPVLSTPLGALPEVFTPGDGLSFVNNEDDFIPLLHRLKNCDIEIRTREKVLPYSWGSIATQLERIYNDVVSCSPEKHS